MSNEKKSDIKSTDAFELFPDIMKTTSPAKDAKGPKQPPPRTGAATPRPPVAAKKPPPPPKPPDISWLWKEEFESVARISDIPTAMVLMPEGESRNMMAKAFEEMGYVIETASSEKAAIDRMKFVNLAGVVIQVDEINQFKEKSLLHNYMKWLPMTKRRMIYYVLVGPDLQTMYDLQALSLSANMVVNTKDMDKIDIIMRKGLQEYESLFGPFISFLQEHGRR